jgi:hypothetical protein
MPVEPCLKPISKDIGASLKEFAGTVDGPHTTTTTKGQTTIYQGRGPLTRSGMATA